MTTRIDSLSHIADHVGSPLGTTDWILITQEQVSLFAEATGDHQWIHVDVERAAAGPFGGTIAHGYLTLSLAPRFLAETVEIGGVTAALNYGLNKVRFPAPVPVGSRIRGHVALTAAQSKPAGIEVVYTLTAELEGGQRPACVAECVVLYR
ncbi:MaoC family dehydratase [Gordonia sp. PP30]|uniref:MaoC family dehydratase n=1 Tax=unclassified Gordonia (in: high G+C Gram-positive bacteria) TaxID=2657482 RepID=UPI00200019B3|nr:MULTISPECIES: MaoC family dehydratase [unclassified Gordonia (in: high G+C Gram-positive bacteria)]UQE73683.1 MaoC family dehydratase [Gordonia sp. PP30]